MFFCLSAQINYYRLSTLTEQKLIDTNIRGWKNKNKAKRKEKKDVELSLYIHVGPLETQQKPG